MRTPEEIKTRIERMRGALQFETDVLVRALSFNDAIPFLKDEFKQQSDARELWETDRLSSPEDVKRAMADYMKFAWGKVRGHRGISTSRSVDKMTAWVWLLGDDDTLKAMEQAPYQNYGAPILAVVCKRYDLPIPDGEDVERMIESLPCEPGCDMGCGR